MAHSRKKLEQMRREPANIRFGDLESVRGIFREATPARHQPCHFQDTLDRRSSVNIQDDKGKAKAYQVRQVLLAIEKLEGMKHER